jgi:hypothetical protein
MATTGEFSVSGVAPAPRPILRPVPVRKGVGFLGVAILTASVLSVSLYAGKALQDSVAQAQAAEPAHAATWTADQPVALQ